MSAGPTRSSTGAVRTVSVLLALVAAFLMMGVIDLFTLLGWVNQDYVWEVPLEASWGALFTFFLAFAYGWLAILPRDPWPALLLLAVCSVALALAAAAGTDVRPLWVAVGVAASALGLWVLLGRPHVPGREADRVHGTALGVAALGIPLWLPYALTAFERSRAGAYGTITQGVEHWPVQGAAGVAIVVAAVVLGLREDCRALFRVAVSLSAVYIGMAELAYPDRAGATGSVVWGVGVTLWGVLVALVSVPRSRPSGDAGRPVAAATVTGVRTAD